MKYKKYKKLHQFDIENNNGLINDVQSSFLDFENWDFKSKLSDNSAEPDEETLYESALNKYKKSRFAGNKKRAFGKTTDTVKYIGEKGAKNTPHKSIIKAYKKTEGVRGSVVIKSGSFAAVFALMFFAVFIMSGFVDACRIVTINDGSNEIVYRTLKTSTDDMLKEKNIELCKEDELNVSDDGHNMTIDIMRAVNVTVTADGSGKSFKINPNATVSDALDKAGVVLGGQDMVNIEQTSKVSEGMTIVVSRINTSDRTSTEAIPHGQEEQKTDTLYVGQTKFIGGGQDGEITHYYRDVIVDGVVAESTETGSRITKEAVNDIVLVGTKKKAPQKPAVTKAVSFNSAAQSTVQLDGNGIPTNYVNIKSGRATAYTGGGTTSTGKPAAVGLVAVDPKVIPYGTRMYIISQDGFVYGYAVAADTGAAMRSGAVLVDLYMNTVEECIKFGSRTVNLYIF